MPIMVYTDLRTEQGALPLDPGRANVALHPELDEHEGKGSGTCAGCREWQEHGPFGMAFCRRWGLQPRDAKRCHAWMPRGGVRQ